ncbi:UNVERIFIED_CONTAM: hypothetical protein GTU68_065856 [Idotea baltica]|nr:hypothetical protein [Idotea baltica]
MSFDLALKHWDEFVQGIWLTLHLTGLALLIGGLIAIPVAFAMLRGGFAGWLAQGYVYVFRGTPLLVQVYIIYYGVSQFDFIRDTWLCPSLRSAWWCALIAFSLNSGAYVAEILRGALKNTPKGELEGAKALGLSEKQVRKLIHFPSAFRRALPQYGNEVIFMLHGSAVASVITLQDILGVGRTINGRYYVAYEGFISAAILYLCITYALIFLFRIMERKYLKHLNIRESTVKRSLFGRTLAGPALDRG